MQRRTSMFVAAAILVVAAAGCVPKAENEVVVYSALDREFAAPILGAFHRANDGQITPVPKYDVESTKTIGLVNRLIAEADAPQCDVFWNNEILHTVRLQKMGLLEPHDWQVGENWPPSMQASDGTWCGFAARGRVLLVNTQLLPDPEQWPQTVAELADPKWQDRCALARPLFGTTATHAAVLDVALGAEQAETFFRAVADNATVLSGNKQVALAVASGQVAWGLTDTDDAIIEKDDGMPVEIVFPDQQPGQPGCLRIPNTVAVLKNAPHPEAARRLVDYLMSSQTEDRLAMGISSQIPVSQDAKVRPHVLPESPVRWMEVDFEAAAERWEQLAPRLEEIFAGELEF
ncbi:extracellular solute-binding protein [Roseimaritima sediminicola]|uniref:extracellular solute-binding protein n=1 Tax=Roseimaritima sediminicola TaxID=2662066 RepID=UPI001F3DEDA0|nr:extracellular solute-binding protein [Roseimaritima sediminicola]